MLEEFKKFALRGNMVDLAVGIIVGSAFSGLVNSIVNDLFMPVIGLFTGGLDFSNMFWQLAGPAQPTLDAAKKVGATIAYGHFITLLINFIIITFVLFIVIKGMNRLAASHEAKEKAEGNDTTSKLTQTETLLQEIRDLMQKEYAEKQPSKATQSAAAKTTKTKAATASKSTRSANTQKQSQGKKNNKADTTQS